MHRFVCINYARSFQNTQVIQTVLSDLYEMNLAVLKIYFAKQKDETIFDWNCKKFDDLKFKEI